MEVAVGSFAVFLTTRTLVGPLVTPSSILVGAAEWKWANTMNSLLHSLLTGCGSLICFYLYPDMGADVVNTYSTLSHALTAFSIGYFVFDFLDMLICHRKRSSYELMLHHAFVISCFGLSLWSGRYRGFVMVALVIEVNSVFLHWRQLLVLLDWPKRSTYYRTVCLLNLSTFLLFRIVTLGWMTRWLALNKHTIPFGVHVLGCIATSTVTIMSIILFLRILKSDFHTLTPQPHPSKGKDKLDPL